IENVAELIPIEIKSGKTYTSDFFRNIGYWRKISGTIAEKCYIVYSGVPCTAGILPALLLPPGWRCSNVA
ncbi:MAG: hypothetical protein ACOC2E_10100, partial [Bacteroidota bacterium]